MTTDAPQSRREQIKIGKSAIHFDQMTWPRAITEDDQVEYNLRYGIPSREDLLHAASVMSAYRALVWKTQKERNKICAVLQKIEIED